MALLSAFFPTNKLVSLESQASDNSVIYLEIDAVRSVGHSSAATVTSFPIESGSNVSDHAVLANRQLELNCVVSGNPFEFINTTRELFDIDQIKNPMSAAEKAKRTIRQLGSVGKILQTDESRLENSYRYVKELHKNRNPIKIVTNYELYKNMIMTNLSISENPTTAGTLEFVARFEEIQIVSNQLLIVSDNKDVSLEYKSGQKDKNLGSQNTETPQESVKNRGASVLVKVFGRALNVYRTNAN